MHSEPHATMSTADQVARLNFAMSGILLASEQYVGDQEDFAEGHLELLQWRGQTLTESEQVSGTNPKHAETETEDVKVAGAMQSTAYAVDIAEEELKPMAQGGADSDKADFRGHKAPTGSSTAFHQTHRPSDR